jgi:hypothetical protein
MTRQTLAATALSLAALPVTLGALLWHSAFRRRDLWVDLDPFEIDLQLHDRNDAPA